MRADAKKHRQTLIVAAAAVFTRDGLDAPLQLVLDETRLGRGTLYRHFPDRESLIEAVLEHLFLHMSELVAENLDSPDLLRRWLRRGAELRVQLQRLPVNIDKERMKLIGEAIQMKFRVLQSTVISQAQSAGVVGPDFNNAEFDLVMRMVAAAGDDDRRSREDAIEHGLDIVFAGLR